MSLSGDGSGSTPLSSNPLQMDNPMTGANSLPEVTRAGLPGAITPSPIPLQQISTATPLAGQAPLNTSLPQTQIQPPPDVMGQLVKVLGSGNRGAQDAAEAMQAARRGVPTAPSAGSGSPGQSLQQATQVMNLIKLLAGGG